MEMGAQKEDCLEANLEIDRPVVLRPDREDFDPDQIWSDVETNSQNMPHIGYMDTVLSWHRSRVFGFGAFHSLGL